MPKRTFKTEQILDALFETARIELDFDNPILLESGEESEILQRASDLLYDEPSLVASNGFENTMELVFEYGGVYWRIYFDQNDGAHYNDLLGCNEFERPWKVEQKEFEAVQVEKATKMVEYWKEVP